MPANVALTPDKIDDLVAATLEKAIKRDWVDISLPYQHYEFARRFMKETNEVSSHKLTWIIQHQNTGSARVTGLFDTDQVDVKNLLVKAEIAWAKVTASFRYDQDEPEFNGPPEQIVDYVAARKHSMYNDYFELMEQLLWTDPAATTDPRSPAGVAYWVQKQSGSAATDFGFNGGNPASENAAGLDVGTYDRWKNGTFLWSSQTDEDLYDKISTACDKTNFKAPSSFNELAGGDPDFGFYTTHSVLQGMRRHAKESNDNLGNDIGAYRGMILFKSIPVVWVPAFTEDTSADAYVTDNPFYGINWKTISWCYQAGKAQKITGPKEVANAHTVRDVFLDSWGQFKCLNRRANFVGAQV